MFRVSSFSSVKAVKIPLGQPWLLLLFSVATRWCRQQWATGVATGSVELWVATSVTSWLGALEVLWLSWRHPLREWAPSSTILRSKKEPNRPTNFDRIELKTSSNYHHPMIRSASAQDQGRQVLHTQTAAVRPVYIGSFNDWCRSGCRQFVSLKNPVARIWRHS